MRREARCGGMADSGILPAYFSGTQIMRPHVSAALLSAVLAVYGTPLLAESEPVHPMIDVPQLPSMGSLKELNTTELKQHRAVYAGQVPDENPAPPEKMEAQLLQALLEYDEERVRILELIPQFIDLYEIDAELAEDMMNFRATLSGIIEELRPNITTLQSYKPYDFRLGVSYVVVMNTLRENEDIRDRMQQDQKDPDTLLGQYTLALQQHYAVVEQARDALTESYRMAELQTRIENIDAELALRERL